MWRDCLSNVEPLPASSGVITCLQWRFCLFSVEGLPASVEGLPAIVEKMPVAVEEMPVSFSSPFLQSIPCRVFDDANKNPTC